MCEARAATTVQNLVLLQQRACLRGTAFAASSQHTFSNSHIIHRATTFSAGAVVQVQVLTKGIVGQMVAIRLFCPRTDFIPRALQIFQVLFVCDAIGRQALFLRKSVERGLQLIARLALLFSFMMKSVMV
jgi:hypothetical protein